MSSNRTKYGLLLGGGVLAGGALAELAVPVGAELRAPDALRPAAGVARPDRELGEFPDAERGGALVEVEEHGRRMPGNAQRATFNVQLPKPKTAVRSGHLVQR